MMNEEKEKIPEDEKQKPEQGPVIPIDTDPGPDDDRDS
jgi:hypothetical protein